VLLAVPQARDAIGALLAELTHGPR
jgi:hypothetical protein